MPRARRVDAPGLFHHVVVRGVERRTVFVDDDDRRDLLRRLDRILPESGMPCLAWVLIPNHFHLLVQTSTVSISRVMARLGTGYARRFNERHGRVGHLFQNRFRSRPIEDDADLLGVLRYVHRNPIKHGLVRGAEELASYPWCGHRALLGREAPQAFHDVPLALRLLDAGDPAGARAALMIAMQDGRPETADAFCQPLSPAGAADEPTESPDALDALIDAIARARWVPRRALLSGGRAKAIVRARAALAYQAHVDLRVPVARLARILRVSEAAIRRGIDEERLRIARPLALAPGGPGLSPNMRNAGPSPNEGQ